MAPSLERASPILDQMVAVSSSLLTVSTVSPGPACELPAEGLLAEPVSAISSLAFVVAGLLILIGTRRRLPRQRTDGAVDGQPASSLVAYAVLVAGVGLGSVVQHGPDPTWSDLAHDLPLLATMAFVAADAFADLTARSRTWWWWVVPTTALMPIVWAAPHAGDLAQVGVAGIAVALMLARARARPRLRRWIGWSLVVLAVGAAVGTLSRAGGPLCVPESVWQGHAAWHALASVALVVLAPAIGHREPAGVRGGSLSPGQ